MLRILNFFRWNNPIKNNEVRLNPCLVHTLRVHPPECFPMSCLYTLIEWIGLTPKVLFSFNHFFFPAKNCFLFYFWHNKSWKSHFRKILTGGMHSKITFAHWSLKNKEYLSTTDPHTSSHVYTIVYVTYLCAYSSFWNMEHILIIMLILVQMP